MHLCAKFKKEQGLQVRATPIGPRVELIKKKLKKPDSFLMACDIICIFLVQEDQEFWTQEFFEEDDNDFAYEEEEASSSSVCLVDVWNYFYPRCQEWCPFVSFILDSTTF